MASFKYIVTIQEPERGGQDSGGWCEWTPKPEVREFSGSGGIGRPSELAIGHARAQHRRPDGTTITIQRRRLIKERYSGIETGVVIESGDLMPYRRYEVQGGVVRRVDK